ncbi:spore germination protein [Paenibacillus sp. BR2-3]|uniref:spore germination protein n=1 Tax=Paenibacillus sp. BR2-3 TaxID=3048494 RepID=UPI00397758AE
MIDSGSQKRGKRDKGSVKTSAGNANIAAPKLSPNLTQTLDNIRRELGASPDLTIRQVQIGGEDPVQAAVVHLGGLVNTVAVNEFVMGSLLDNSHLTAPEMSREPEDLLQLILCRAMGLGEAEIKSDWNEIMIAILSGDTLILLDGCTKGIVGGTKGGEWRTITEPSSQLVVRGPKDAFVESVSTNISLIRRRIKSPKLWFEFMRIGKVTNTDVAIIYIKNIADDKIVDEVRTRLKRIDIEAVLESSYIEQLIQDKVLTPFPTVYNTERPDVAAANLLEGRIVLIVDGTPFVLILPTVFAQFFQSTDDYAQRFDIATLMRMVRYVSFIILLLGPSIYIALTTFHYEMIPTPMLISLLAQRENVPFPAAVEAMLMEIAFEVLREAGTRMPRAVGQTVSVVGALILGQAVVEAGIITPVMVIVVALTGIASFAIPSNNLAIAGRIVRFGFIAAASVFGFYGITLGLIVLVAHMNSLRSFGVPYLSPFSPFSLRGQKDTLVRVPMWMIHLRPHKSKDANNNTSNDDESSASGKEGRTDA